MRHEDEVIADGVSGWRAEMSLDGEERPTPEQTLWTHVLYRAVQDATLLEVKDYKCREARRWLRSSGKTVGSFLWICEEANFIAGRVRGWTLNLIAEGKAYRRLVLKEKKVGGRYVRNVQHRSAQWAQ